MNNIVNISNLGNDINGNQENGSFKYVAYVLLTLILMFIVAYIAWKATKKKREKRKMEKIENKKANETLMLYYEFILTYKLIIDFTQKEFQKFENKETNYKMGQIKSGAKKLLIKLITRDDFAFSFQNDEKYAEFVRNAELLTLTQPNLWNKKIANVLTFFENQFNSIPKEKFNEKLELITIDTIRKQFYEK
ncbi:MHJ_0274 family protein [Metamycoplasma canadense]|nr:hypothetical protein [Metamycoplasma canadense]